MSRALCDNAPLEAISLTSTGKKVTLIYPYYENPLFFERQLHGWHFVIDRELRKYLSLILVDDGSPVNPAQAVLQRVPVFFPTRLFRIEVDVRWNWLAARNIGAHHAETEWLLLTDMDHVIPAETMNTVVFGKHDPGTIYRFSRREHTDLPIHPHPNSWLMTKAMFWKVGGYDEALSGYYGTDGEYRTRCAQTAPIRIQTVQLVRHEYDGDSSTTHYLRKQLEDAQVKKLIRARTSNWKPRVLSFPYREIAPWL